MKITGLREKLGLPADRSDSDLVNPIQLQMGLVLYGTRPQGQVYAGTVPEHVVARRRKKNKQAARSRRTNRGRR